MKLYFCEYLGGQDPHGNRIWPQSGEWLSWLEMLEKYGKCLNKEIVSDDFGTVWDYGFKKWFEHNVRVRQIKNWGESEVHNVK